MANIVLTNLQNPRQKMYRMYSTHTVWNTENGDTSINADNEMNKINVVQTRGRVRTWKELRYVLNTTTANQNLFKSKIFKIASIEF